MATTALAGVPEAPMGLTATAVGTDTIELSWTAPNEGVAPITDYKIERSVDSGATWTNAEATANVTDDAFYSDSSAGVGSQGETQYRVSAINRIGTGPVSDTASATTPVSTAQPGMPTSVMAMADGATVINLMWEAPTNMGASDITGYVIEYSKDVMLPWMDVATTTVTTGDDGTSYSDTGLAPETERHYRVSAVNNSGRGPVSTDAAMATTALAGVPEAPMGLTATAVETTTIELSWTAPNEGVAPITDYKIERSVDSGATWTNAEATANVTDDAFYSDSSAGVGSQGETQYRVSAINRIGTGPVSDTASATTPVSTAQPGMPTSVMAMADGATVINLMWEAPTNMGASDITGYVIEYSKDVMLPWMDVATTTVTTGDDGTSYSDTGLAPETERHYRVSAVNNSGRGPVSTDAAMATTALAGVPEAPMGLTATAVETTTIELSWTAPNEGRAPITDYKIERSVDSGATWTNAEATANVTDDAFYSDSSAGVGSQGETQYRVSAINPIGTGPVSDTASATTPVSTKQPGMPTLVMARQDGATEIELTWTVPINMGASDITGYVIEYSKDGMLPWMEITTTGDGGTSYDDTGLAPETERHYRVSAVNILGRGPVSIDAATATTTRALQGIPGAPTGLTAMAVSGTEIELSWTAPADAGDTPITGYRIESSATGSSSWAALMANTGSTDTSYTDASLMQGMTRHYQVAAINSAGQGPASDSDRATTPVLPGAPTGLTAMAMGRTQIDLAWTAPEDTGDAAVMGYRIEYSADDGSWMDLRANTASTDTTYSHMGVDPDTMRYYRVSAISSVGTGMPSNVDMAMTEALMVPGAPTGLMATKNGPMEINLAWSAPTETGGADITGYQIETSTDGNDPWTILMDSNAGTSYSDMDLEPGTTKHYRVLAINSVGMSQPSNVDSATTATVPGAPTGLTATAMGRTQIDLSWTAPTFTGGEPITGYQIESSADGSDESWMDLMENTASTDTTYSDIGLDPETMRHYRVSAINSVGMGMSSNVDMAMTEALMTPGMPTDLTATADGPIAINLSWMAPADNGGADITGYQIETSTDGNDPWTIQMDSNPGTSYTDSGLDPDTMRHYRVSAINSVGTGMASMADRARTTAAPVEPGMPTDLTAMAMGRTQTDLSWTAPTETGGADITGYQIETSTDGNDPWTILMDSNPGISYTDSGLDPETMRYYRVSAINSVGTGMASDTAMATTDALMVPGMPTDLTAMAMGRTQIDLSWTAPTETGGADITGYQIETSTDGNDPWAILMDSNPGTSYTDSGLEPETMRYYRVSAINSVGTGMASDAAMATTDALMVPGMPTDLTATADGASKIDLAWTAPTETGGADITGYMIEYSADGSDGSWMDLMADTASMDTTYSDMGLDPETMRYYRVSAINSAGTGMLSMADSATTTTAEAVDPLLAEYDPNGDGVIEKADMRIAVQKFFAVPAELSKSDMRRLVRIYFLQ